MDAQELRNLQEAYMEVVENQQLDEGYKTRNAAKIMNKKDSLRKKGDLESLGRAGDIERKLYRRDFSAQNPDVEERINKLREPKRSKLVSDNNKKKTFGNRLTRSDGQGIHDSYEYDLYDIVLSHLLDEGYAETPEAAEVIMVNMSEEWRDEILEATAMAKRGYDETSIRQKIASKTGGGESADRATALADKPTYGWRGANPKARQELARKQRGDFRKTTSSNPGLHGYGHQSNDPAVKAKQAARGAQRGVLTPAEKRSFGR